MKKNKADLLAAFMILFVLILFGVWYFQYEEGWNWVNSFYFTVMTITTVGYGDLVPTHDISKIITAFYALISIPLVIFALGTIAKAYFEERLTKIEHRMAEMLTREKTLEEDLEEVIHEDVDTLNELNKAEGDENGNI